MTSWIFQGNPRDFQIDKYINNNKEIYWGVRQYKGELKDTFCGVVYIWRADGDEKGSGGIVAKGKIVDYPRYMPNDAPELWKPMRRLNSETLFSWEDIPGDHSKFLINILNINFGIDWVRSAKIEKINDRKISVLDDKNRLSLSLNNEKNKVELRFNKVRPNKKPKEILYEFIAKAENNKLNIYCPLVYRIKIENEIEDVRLTEDEGMLMRTDLEKDDVVKDMLIFRRRYNTNYKLETKHSEHIDHLWEQKKK